MGKGEAQRPPFDPVSCSYDPADPYEPRARFGKGPWKGNVWIRKSADRFVFCTCPERLPRPWFLRMSITMEGYWTASIPTDAVYDVYFQLEYFPAIVPAGHTQARIEFFEPVRLLGQSSWNRGERSMSTTLWYPQKRFLG